MENTKSRSRLTQIIFLTQSIFSAAFTTGITVLSITAYEISGQESLSSLPHSVMTFTPAIAAYSMSLVMNKSGWRYGLSIGYIYGAIGALLGVLAIQNHSYFLILLAAVFLGAARASADLSRYAVGQMFEANKRARMIGRVVFASAIGGIIGPLLIPLSTNFGEGMGFSGGAVPWAVAICLYLLASLINLIFLKPDPNSIAKALNQNAQKEDYDNSPDKTSALSLFKLPVVQLAVSAMAISQLVMVVLMVMTPLHIHKMHYSNEVISYVISAHVFGMFGLAAITGYLIDRFGHIPMLFVGALVLASAVILAPLTSSGIVLAVALFLLGLGWNFGYVSGSSLLSTSLPQKQRSKIQGINDSLIALIAGTASLGSGPLFAFGGYFALSMAGLLIVIFLMILIYFLSQKHKIQTAV